MVERFRKLLADRAIDMQLTWLQGWFAAWHFSQRDKLGSPPPEAGGLHNKAVSADRAKHLVDAMGLYGQLRRDSKHAKNDGVAAQIQQNPGAVGYIELSYAITNGIPVADMINEDGSAVTPTLASTAAAADGITIPDDLRFNILGVGGEGYPIAGATWVLAWTCGYEDHTAVMLKDYLTWVVTEGDDLAEKLLYSPLSNSLEASALEKISLINSAN